MVFFLANSGESAVTGLSVRLITNDPLVEIINAESSFPDVAANRVKNAIAEMSVSFRVVRDIGEAHEAIVILEVHNEEQMLVSQEVRVTAHPSNSVSGSVVGEEGEALPDVPLVSNEKTELRRFGRTETDG